VKTSVENTSLCLEAMDLGGTYGEGNDRLNLKLDEAIKVL
jgi:hypothetical protein